MNRKIAGTVTDSNPVVIIAGPTASGKSALALDVAREFSGTVINADSMQVYEDLSVLTARPGEGSNAAVPHRLLGVLPASGACSAGRWLTLAAGEIEAAWGGGRLPAVARRGAGWSGWGVGRSRIPWPGLIPLTRFAANVTARMSLWRRAAVRVARGFTWRMGGWACEGVEEWRNGKARLGGWACGRKGGCEQP